MNMKYGYYFFHFPRHAQERRKQTSHVQSQSDDQVACVTRGNKITEERMEESESGRLYFCDLPPTVTKLTRLQVE